MSDLDMNEEFRGCGCPACILHHLKRLQRGALRAAQSMGSKGKTSFEEIRSLMISIALEADVAHEVLEDYLAERQNDEGEEPPPPESHGYH
jgi:hypothetical protein